VVPVGGLVITGVGWVVSLLLHAANNIRNTIARRFLAQRRKGAEETQRRSWFFFTPLRLCVRNALLVLIILKTGSFTSFLRHGFAGHTILTLNPAAKVNKLTAFRTEGTERILFPLDWLTAGWTLHELTPRSPRLASKRCGSFEQYSSFDECDRTFAAHGIQADGDAFTG
jgi:hypothetical protein